MCELLGMSSNHRTTINLSLTVLAKRGENPHLHGDGWGVAFYEGKDVRLIKDSGEAKGSDWVEFIKEQEIHSHDVIAHIRKSTIGHVSYSNTHPFTRELWGRMHTFAHNGTLLDIEKKFHPKHFKSVGTTDSEYAFCLLMDHMFKIWGSYEEVPPLEIRLQVVANFAKEMRELGLINFLYSDGETLFAHGHKRHNPLTNQIESPGLHYIKVKCEEEGNSFQESSQSGIAMKGKDHLVTLFASVPLNDEEWRPVKEGEVLAVTKGQIEQITF